MKANVVAASPFCFGSLHPFVAYKEIVKTGLRHVEVPALPFRLAMHFDLPSFVPEVLGPDDVRALRQRLDGMGLTPISVAAFCDLLEPGEADALDRRIDFAHGLGAETYVLTDATNHTDLAGRERQLIDALRAAADRAAERGVRIALEIHEGPTRNGAVAAEFLDRVNHPSVGINYDTGNVYYFNDAIDPAEDIHHVANRVISVHLKDTCGGKGEWQFCTLGAGRVNFPSILRTLQTAGFTGPYSLEVEGLQGEDLNREGYRRRLEASLAYLKTLGISAEC